MKIQRGFHHCGVVGGGLLLLLAACAGPSAPVAPAVPTRTEVVVPATQTQVPAPKPSPAPTTLPGLQVVPITSMESSIPWLPLVSGDEPMSVYYGFNFEIPPFDDVLVRKAFAAAVDREQIALEAERLGFKRARPATTLTPPNALGRDLYGEVGIPFDPVQAAQWLRDAGYTDASSFPNFTLLTYMRGGAPGAYYQIGKMVADMWEQHLGVRATVDAVEHPSAVPGRFASAPPAVYLWAWGADMNDPDNFLRRLLHSDSDVNYGRFANAEYNRLVDRAAGLVEPAERQLLYIQAERILTEEEVAVIPLFFTLWYSRL